MSKVYLAIARGPAGFNKLVVLKQLLSGLVTEAQFLDMFLDEARLAARLNHPNIVQTNEVGFADEKYFIAMEYLDGQPLLKIVQRLLPQRLPIHVVLGIAADVCAGLHYAHTLADFSGTPLGIVHRDVSPHNIFLTYAGQVKLVDFGIAKAASRTTETETGILKGKIAYMSPEHLGGVDIDGRSDIFSLGVVLYEALTGQRMWGSPTRDVNIVKRLVAGDVPTSPRLVVPDLPEDVDRICQRALSIDRDKRYATALEMQKELEASMSRLPRRSSERDVGEMIAGLFEEERRSITGIIEKQLSLLDASSTEEFALHSLPAIHVASGIMSAAPGKDSNSAALGITTEPRSDPAMHRRRTVVVLAVVFGILAVVALWGLSQNGSDPAGASAAGPAPSAHGATALPSATSAPVATVAPTADTTSDATPAQSGRIPVTPAFAPPARRGLPYAYPRSNASNEAPAPPPQAVVVPSPKAVAAPTFGPLDDRH